MTDNNTRDIDEKEASKLLNDRMITNIDVSSGGIIFTFEDGSKLDTFVDRNDEMIYSLQSAS